MCREPDQRTGRPYRAQTMMSEDTTKAPDEKPKSIMCPSLILDG